MQRFLSTESVETIHKIDSFNYATCSARAVLDNREPFPRGFVILRQPMSEVIVREFVVNRGSG